MVPGQTPPIESINYPYSHNHNQILGRGTPATRSARRLSPGRVSESAQPRQAPRSSMEVCSWRS
eukprot:143305-Pleurochrysis_carterae.AAC.3